MSPKGIQVVHTIANGSIEDKNGEDQRIGKKMSEDAVVCRVLLLRRANPTLRA